MESELIAWLRSRVGPSPRVPLGIGDDAALVRASDRGLLVTVDMLNDGVDFILAECDPRRIGRKALAVNLSDVAAMAGIPRTAVVALAIPRSASLELVKALYEGMFPLAERHGVALVGGDTNTWAGPLAISITLLAEPTARGPLTRSGGQPGDRLLVTGPLGGSILGHHFDFEPRVAEALHLHEHYALHAGMDISDGLSLDLSRLAEASGCGARLELPRVPISTAARELAARSPNGRTALDHALGDGEDFELLLAAEPAAAERLVRDQPLGLEIVDIGELTAAPGLIARDEQGREMPLIPTGYRHELDA